MPRRSPEVDVKPAVLKWARESAGWTVEEIAAKLKVPASFCRQCENTGRGLRITQLEVLATHLKRPLAAFLLPNPPKESGPPRDFRVLPGRAGKFEKRTLLAVRRAIRLQTIAGELAADLQLDTAPEIGKAGVHDDPEMVSARERERLGITLDEQFKWRSEWEALDHWRDAIENKKVFVFSLSMPLDDARGFSLSELLPWAVVVNTSDAMRARIFTLFHEYAHLLLRTPGVCLPAQEWARPAAVSEEERWCNQFAAALLLPSQAVQGLAKDREFGQKSLAETLWDISQRFKVSQEVALRRLWRLRLVTEQEFRIEMERLQAIPRRKRKGGAARPALACVRGNGRLFTRLVLEGREKGTITYANVADYLGIRLKHLEKVQALVAA